MKQGRAFINTNPNKPITVKPRQVCSSYLITGMSKINSYDVVFQAKLKCKEDILDK